MENHKIEFLNYLMQQSNDIQSYKNFINSDLRNSNKFENIIKMITNRNVFEISDANELIKLLRLLKQNKMWIEYDKSHSNRIPHAILNKHYKKFLLNNYPKVKGRPLFDMNTKKLLNKSNTYALNTILYGPPGTGKTYEISQIIKDLEADVASQKLDFNKLIESEEFIKSEWWVKIALTIMYNGNKPLTCTEITQLPILKQWYLRSDKYKSWHSFDRSVNAELQKRTVRQNRQQFKLNKSDYFEEKNNKYKLSAKGTVVLHRICEQIGLDFPTENVINTNSSDNVLAAKQYYSFCTFHQSYSYEEFVEGIRPVINKKVTENNEQNEENVTDTSINFEFHTGIFKSMCNRARKQPDKKFYMFIDEINRGNISKIFGELITLLEDDKRENVTGDTSIKYNTIAVNLPYTNERFTVPNNLYVIGTMNTADKSLTHLDIALRRRFEFVPKYPKYQGEIEYKNPKYSEFLKQINDKIFANKKQNPDYLIGHTYFLGDDSLVSILNKKVIPLLTEYFNNRIEDVKSILSEDLLNSFGIQYDDSEKYYLKVK